MFKKIKKYKTGFTLIELLVVVAIISLLSSIVLASLNSARAKARDATRMSDIKQIQNAVELYILSNGGAPDIFAVDREDSWNDLSSFLVPKYIAKLPKDPCGATASSSCTTKNPTTIGDWLAYSYYGPSILLSEGTGVAFGVPITNTTYTIMAENLEAQTKTFGFGVGSF